MKIHLSAKRLVTLSTLLSLSLLTTLSFARSFSLPPSDESIIGKVQHKYVSGERVSMIAHAFNLGQNAMMAANPGTPDNGYIRGDSITVPTKYMLPPLDRRGIIINLPEMRMYYFPKGSNLVMTYPIGIGKIGKTIPVAHSASITRKVVNPHWTPPEDIRDFNRAQGIELPKTMGPGPDNPLGPYAIYLSIPTYLIHSTIFPESIGTRASFGCIRMNEDDIKEFFPAVTPGTPVVVIDMPNKINWQKKHLYMESHPPLEENSQDATFANVVANIDNQTSATKPALVNWQMVAFLSEHPDGIPHDIGMTVKR